MQQLTDIVLDFNAFLRDGNRAFIPFRLRIREPRLDEDTELYFCIVDCPALKLTDFRVPGDNGNQACNVASEIVRAHFEAEQYALTEGNGDPVTIPDVPVTWQMSTLRFRPRGLPPRPQLFKTDGILLNFEAFIKDRKDAPHGYRIWPRMDLAKSFDHPARFRFRLMDMAGLAVWRMLRASFRSVARFSGP